MRSELEIDPSPAHVQSSKNIKEFKNALIRRKYTEYQNKLEDSIRHKYYEKRYHLLTQEERIEWKKDGSATLCSEYRCNNVIVAYIRYNRSMDNGCVHSFDSYTKQITYDTFKNFNQARIEHQIDMINVKEYLWYNITSEHNISDNIVITGDYSISMRPNEVKEQIVWGEKRLVTSGNYTTYQSKGPHSLRLNDVPVSYVSRRLKNISNSYNKCIKLYFTFDMTTYCDTIDTVIRARRDCHSRFYRIPKELILLILSFT